MQPPSLEAAPPSEADPPTDGEDASATPEFLDTAPILPVTRPATTRLADSAQMADEQPLDEPVADDPSQEVVDASVAVDDLETVEAARMAAVRLQPFVEPTPVPVADPVAEVAAQPAVDEAAQPGVEDRFAAFAAADLFPQAVPTPETAGVQTASITSDRTAITVEVAPPLDRVLQAIGAEIPSTGGPTALALAMGLLGLGGLGLGLRWAGRERTRRS